MVLSLSLGLGIDLPECLGLGDATPCLIPGRPRRFRPPHTDGQPRIGSSWLRIARDEIVLCFPLQMPSFPLGGQGSPFRRRPGSA